MQEKNIQAVTGIQPNRYWRKDEALPSSGGTWGTITGTLSNQTDLQTALDAKANTTALSGYVPYTGASGNVDLGANALLAQDVSVNSISEYGAGAGITLNNTTNFGAAINLNAGNFIFGGSGQQIQHGANTFDFPAVSGTLATQSAVDAKIDKNTAITGATKTKVTYDTKGLVTAGADATTTDIAEGTNLYFTDERAQDAIGNSLGAGLSYNDATGAISSTITQYTDEMAQDAVGAMVDGTLVYVDATPLLTRAALTGDVTAPQASNVTTLATVNSNVGLFTNASVTVNGKGLVTAASSGPTPEVPLTFSTGLTRSTNTITVNTSQNIAKLSNLTGNGFVKTSAGDGTLSVDTNTYLTTASAASTYQPLDADLTSWAGVTRASGFDTFAATPSSANLRSLVTDETGTGALVFGTSPSISTSLTVDAPLGGGVTVNIPTATGQKARMGGLNNVNNWFGTFLNTSFNGTNWDLDDTTKDGWFFKLDARTTGSTTSNGIQMWRVPNGANPHTNEQNLFSITGGETVINDGGADQDFRVEAVSEANMLFVDASAAKIGIGTSAPSELVHAKKDVNANTTVVIENPNAGTGAYASIDVRNGSSVLDGFRAGVLGTGYTTSGGFVQDSAFFSAEANVSNGISIMANATNAPIRFYAGGSTNLVATMNSTGNIKMGGTATRGTTEGTNQLVIFNGTAPVGTLTNGISLYSTAGELRVMDAAGNATLLSPHEKGTNYWIYDSVDTTTGKHLRIDMERLMKAVDKLLGGGFINEYYTT